MPDDGRRYELSHGVLVVTPGPNTNHQAVAFCVARHLDDHRLPTQAILLEAELRIRDDTVKRPDVQVVDESLIGGQDITGTPALVVEVASPSTTLLDGTEKRHVYAEAGIPAYWLVDPDARTITVLELDDGAYVERVVLDHDGRAEVSHPTVFELDASAVFGIGTARS
jgi:Uma2 family endonuclease